MNIDTRIDSNGFDKAKRSFLPVGKIEGCLFTSLRFEILDLKFKSPGLQKIQKNWLVLEVS